MSSQEHKQEEKKEIQLFKRELQRVTTELYRVVKELEFRMTVTSAMLGTLDLEQILYIMLSGITSGDGLGFNRAFLFLDDESGRELKVVMAVGPSSRQEALKIWEGLEKDGITLTELLPRYELYRSQEAAHELSRKLRDFSLPLERLESLAASPHALIVDKRAPLVSVVARCLVNRSPFASNALVLFQEVGGPRGEEMTFSHLAVAPLQVGGRLIGAILADNLFSEMPVGPESLRSLAALGNLAALAIDRARLHAKTLAMAEVDGLTGVYNRRFYEAELDRMLEQSRHSGVPLSLVLFDLDRFKDYNDTYGHLVGDEVLKEVARLLSRNVRSTDRVARYGGEEFVLLLTSTPLRQAAQVAVKLCQLVKSEPLVDGRVKGLTLSAGVASTDGSDSPHGLFQRADQALYQAKARGRDRVEVWESA